MVNNPYQKHLILSLLFLLGLSTLPCVAHEVGELKRAEDAFVAKHYAEAEQILKRLAEDGSPRAARILGNVYMTGRGVPAKL